MTTLAIGDRPVGPDAPPYLIADIGANHDGSPRARAASLRARGARRRPRGQVPELPGADDRLPARLRRAAPRWRTRRPGRSSVYDAYVARQRLAGLDGAARGALPRARHRVPDHAVRARPRRRRRPVRARRSRSAPGDVTWPELLRHVASKGKPVLLGTGASTLDDVERALGRPARPRRASCSCSATRTTPATRRTSATSTCACCSCSPSASRRRRAGAVRPHARPRHGRRGGRPRRAGVEKHFTDDTTREGPDHGFAMTPRDVARDGRPRSRWTDEALGDGVKRVEDNERGLGGRAAARAALRPRPPGRPRSSRRATSWRRGPIPADGSSRTARRRSSAARCGGPWAPTSWSGSADWRASRCRPTSCGRSGSASRPRDWQGVAGLLADDVVVEWPASKERMVGAANVVAVNAEYPEGWSIRVLRVVADGAEVVSEVEVPHGDDVHRAASFWTVEDGRIVRGREYWTAVGRRSVTGLEVTVCRAALSTTASSASSRPACAPRGCPARSCWRPSASRCCR